MEDYRTIKENINTLAARNVYQMSVIDDIKDKMSGGDDNSLDSDFDSSLGDDSQDSLGASGSGDDLNLDGNNTPQGSQRGQSNSPNNPQGNHQGNPQRGRNGSQGRTNSGANQNSRNSQRGGGQRRNSSQPNNQGSRSSGGNSPNPQTGRPQPGQSSPQVSQNTERKMQKMMNDSEPQSVSQDRSDMEELKSQNEQIIELLKRINRNLGGGQR